MTVKPSQDPLRNGNKCRFNAFKERDTRVKPYPAESRSVQAVQCRLLPLSVSTADIFRLHCTPKRHRVPSKRATAQLDTRDIR